MSVFLIWGEGKEKRNGKKKQKQRNKPRPNCRLLLGVKKIKYSQTPLPSLVPCCIFLARVSTGPSPQLIPNSYKIFILWHFSLVPIIANRHYTHYTLFNLGSWWIVK